MWNSRAFADLSGFIIVLALVFQSVTSFTIIMEEQESESRNPAFPHQPGSEEFKRWLQDQGEKTVQKIMDKIVDPNDTMQQYEAKVAVARYLVNVTFAAMTKRLNLGKSVVIPETAVIPETSEMPNEAAFMAMMESRAQNASESNTTEGYEEMLLVLGGGNLTFPEEGIPASAPIVTSTENGTETTTMTSKPLWQELLTFNFSAAFSGEGGNGLLNLSRLTSGNGAGGNSLFNLTRLTGGSEGGANNLFNLSRLSGGEGGSNLFNLSRLSGGEGSSNLFNLSRFSGGEGANGLFNLSRFSGGEGGPSSLFNISRFTGGSGGSRLSSLLNISSIAEGGLFNFPSGRDMGEAVTLNPNASSSEESGVSGVLPFVLPTPPEGFLNFPTPPPKNDSVRMSQMVLGNQVEKLVGDINKNNLTGVVDSTINIATPSTVGVLVNALLNIVLCNPLDRWNGNCGV